MSDQAERVRLISTPRHEQIAQIIAEQRFRGHTHTRKRSEDLGSGAANRAADVVGVLAELLVIEGLEVNGLKPEGYRFLADTPPSGPDFTLNGVRYQVKCVPYGKQFVCINERQRCDFKQATDYYLVVKFVKPGIAYVAAPIHRDVVAEWQLRDDRHSPYRSTALSGLRPLRRWNDLLIPNKPLIVTNEQYGNIPSGVQRFLNKEKGEEQDRAMLPCRITEQALVLPDNIL